MKTKVLGYWLATAIIIFVMFSGAVGELTRSWGTLETVTILGYPRYVLTIIGFWKILACIALLAPGSPRLKEWAYAGIFFNMTGAAVSHAAVSDYGDYGFHIISTLSIVALSVTSWALRPQSRILGTVMPAKIDA